MSRSHDHDLHALFAPARAAVPSRATVDDALELAPHREPRRRRPSGTLRRVAVAAALLLVVLAGSGYAAAPPIRAAVDDVAGSFAGWFGGDDAPAGRPARAEDRLPDYLRDPATLKRTRVVAEAGGYRLFAARLPSGTIDFDLGNTGVGMGFEPGSLLENDVRVLGPGSMARPDARGHVPLFGVTSRRVATVELENRDGTSSPRTDVDGAFVLLAEPVRHPVAVVGRDARGEVVERRRVDRGPVTDATDPDDCPCIDWGQYLRR